MGRTKSVNKLPETLVQALKDSASRVNQTLSNYEQDYISATRTSNGIDKEPCNSLQDFVEIRFNRECLEIPELKEPLEMCNGHLFICRELKNADPKTRRFDHAIISLIEEGDIDSEVDKIIKKRDDINIGVDVIRRQYPELIEELTSSLKKGMTLAKAVLKDCTKFKFNSVKRKIKLTNEKNKKL